MLVLGVAGTPTATCESVFRLSPVKTPTATGTPVPKVSINVEPDLAGVQAYQSEPTPSVPAKAEVSPVSKEDSRVSSLRSCSPAKAIFFGFLN